MSSMMANLLSSLASLTILTPDLVSGHHQIRLMRSRRSRRVASRRGTAWPPPDDCGMPGAEEGLLPLVLPCLRSHPSARWQPLQAEGERVSL
jgi:hypothetical protein